jgi:diacylglycerol kinase (ATP)
MKKPPLPLSKRFQFSVDGLVAAWQAEASLRLVAAAIVVVVVLLALLRAHAAWWAIFTLLAAGILSAELVNTAIENMCDLFHPEVHARIKIAKDCASAAVFVLNTAALLVLILFLRSR